MKLKLSNIPTSMALAFTMLFVGALVVYASDGSTASINTPISVTGPDGVCKRVTNNSATSLSEYIPTASVAEWQSFVAHPPAGVTLSSCCTGIVYNGVCYVLGSSGQQGQSCTTICSAAAGATCNLAQTQALDVLSGTTLCETVQAQFGYTTGVKVFNFGYSPAGCGLTYASGPPYRYNASANARATCEGTETSIARLCACQ